MQRSLEKGYYLCEYNSIRIIAKMLDIAARVGTVGFLVGVSFAVIDVFINKFL